MIITFEGGEGAGKSTNAVFLCSYLTSKGLPWRSFREPGGSSISEEVREIFLKHDMDIMAELMLVLASRRQNIREIIEPCIANNVIIVIDRFVDSTVAYQGIVGGLGRDNVYSIMQQTMTWIEPDLTFTMDVRPEIALKRIRPSDRFEHRDIEYHIRLREAFLRISNEKRHRIIDSSLSRDTVRGMIIQEVEALIAHGGVYEKNNKTS